MMERNHAMKKRSALRHLRGEIMAGILPKNFGDKPAQKTAAIRFQPEISPTQEGAKATLRWET
jgi:hypothetical protein